MRWTAMLAAAILAGCATTPPKPVTVLVPTPVRCVPVLGPAPAYPDTDAKLAAAPDIYSGTALLVAGRTLRIAREAELNAALSGCTGAVP